MWENYVILERLKKNQNQPFPPRPFFWRTMEPQSHKVDYIEVAQGQINAWEIKYNPHTKAKIPQAFLNAYPTAQTGIVTPDNLDEFLLD